MKRKLFTRQMLYRLLLVVAVLVVLALLNYWFTWRRGDPLGDTSHLPRDTTPAGQDGTYLFCFWNVENLFDDRDDDRKGSADAQYDQYFGNNHEALRHKLNHLCDVLIPLNGGRGPDILAVAEVESERAAQLLANALNRRLGVKSYTSVLFDPSSGGRQISTGLITRLGVVRDRTESWGRRLRILKAVVRAERQDLTVVISHWTSRISDQVGKGRARYAEVIYGEYRSRFLAARRAGNDLHFLVCGDFNDNPDDPSVSRTLHASGDAERVKSSNTPLLFNLLAKAYDRGEATHVYGRKRHVFDHICVSPAMLGDSGWTADVDSAQIVKQMADRQGRPKRFGGASDKRPYSARGAADHFPVTVRLRVR